MNLYIINQINSKLVKHSAAYFQKAKAQQVFESIHSVFAVPLIGRFCKKQKLCFRKLYTRISMKSINVWCLVKFSRPWLMEAMQILLWVIKLQTLKPLSFR